jgi:hypothetical protein
VSINEALCLGLVGSAPQCLVIAQPLRYQNSASNPKMDFGVRLFGFVSVSINLKEIAYLIILRAIIFILGFNVPGHF